MLLAPRGVKQHKGSAAAVTALGSLQDEIARQCRMAFARMDHHKQNFERRMKKQAVSLRARVRDLTRHYCPCCVTL